MNLYPTFFPARREANLNGKKPAGRAAQERPVFVLDSLYVTTFPKSESPFI